MLSWYRNARVAGKILSAFVVVAGIAVAVGAVGAVAIRSLGRSQRDVYANNVVGLETLGNLLERLQDRVSQVVDEVAAASDQQARA